MICTFTNRLTSIALILGRIFPECSGAVSVGIHGTSDPYRCNGAAVGTRR